VTVQWHQPFSSNISRLGHDPDTGEMFVEWNTGRTSVYEAVPGEKFDIIRKSPSVTQAINMEIKPSHSHRYATQKQ
jgi:hypothetical protein